MKFWNHLKEWVFVYTALAAIAALLGLAVFDRISWGAFIGLVFLVVASALAINAELSTGWLRSWVRRTAGNLVKKLSKKQWFALIAAGMALGLSLWLLGIIPTIGSLVVLSAAYFLIKKRMAKLPKPKLPPGANPAKKSPGDWIDPRPIMYGGIFILYASFSFLVVGALMNQWVGLATLTLLVGATIRNDWVELSSDNPPMMAILKIFGKLVPVKIKWGFQLLPWRGFLTNLSKPFKIDKTDLDMAERVLVTPDHGTVAVKPSLILIPDYDSGARALIDLLLMGGMEGAMANIDQIVDQRLKSWAIADSEGPQTYEEAMSADTEATLVVLKRLVGAALTEVNSPIPTTVLLRYLNVPQELPTRSMAARYSEDPVKRDWKKLDVEWLKLGQDNSAEQQRIVEAIKARRQEVLDAQSGEASYPKNGFGVRILQFNMGEILPTGETAKALGKGVKETLEAESELIEAKGNTSRYDWYCEWFEKKFGRKPTFEEIRDWDQTERTKSVRTIYDVRGGGVLPLLPLSSPTPTPAGAPKTGGTT